MRQLRTNAAKVKLAAGGTVSVAMGPMSPEIVELLGQFDFDAIWLEAEHGAIDFADIGDLTRACDLWGKAPIARVNVNVPGLVYRTLDVGAMGVAVPHIKTAEEAAAVVDAAKFGPIGSRGNFGGRQSYGVKGYIPAANDQTMIVLLVESVTGIENLAEIIAVDHVDAFFIARSDLSQSMGLVGQPDHPDVVAVVDDAFAQINAAGKAAGTSVSGANVARYIAAGARFLTVQWPEWLSSGAEAYLETVATAVRKAG